MRFSSFVEYEDVKEAYRLMRDAIRSSATDPKTGKIDMSLLDTGVGQQDRKLRGDMRKEVLNILDASTSGGRGVKWNDVMSQLESQSSIWIDAAAFSEVVRALESEGVVKVVGDRDRRTIRRVEGG
jgi:DNA replication licensing factor MCM4